MPTGLGACGVRGGRRVRLAVYLKALACNFKRMVHARLVEMENAAQRTAGTLPAVAAAGGSRSAASIGRPEPERIAQRDHACPERNLRGR